MCDKSDYKITNIREKYPEVQEREKLVPKPTGRPSGYFS